MNHDEDMRYLGAQIEETNSNVKAILEIVVPIHKGMIGMKKQLARLPEIEGKLDTAVRALTDTNKDVANHETHITRLEAHAA